MCHLPDVESSLTGIIASHILKGPDPPRRGSDGPGLANILSHQIKVRAVVRYRAGYPIGKFGTVKQNRGPNVVRCRAFAAKNAFAPNRTSTPPAPWRSPPARAGKDQSAGRVPAACSNAAR